MQLAISTTANGETINLEGKCLYTWRNGDTFEGEWKGEYRPHAGKFTSKRDGDTYDGQWENGNCHGKGVATYKDEGKIYSGPWHNGLREGQGKVTMKNGDSYVVNFVQDLEEGAGVLTEKISGHTHKIHFRHGKRLWTLC